MCLLYVERRRPRRTESLFSLTSDGKNILALAEARESSKAGKWIPHEEVLAELGLTPEDVDKFQEPK